MPPLYKPTNKTTFTIIFIMVLRAREFLRVEHLLAVTACVFERLNCPYFTMIPAYPTT